MLNGLLSANVGLSQFEDFWHQPSINICQLFFFLNNNLMLFAWAGFVSAVWTFVFDANESHLNMSERETDKRAQHRNCVCVVIFGQKIKNTAEQQDSLFCLHHISHKHAYTVSIHSQTLNTHNNHTNAANHSSIFYAKMHKTSATLCKLQLMCLRGRKQREQAENIKVERRSEWEQSQMKKTGRKKQLRKMQEKMCRKKKRDVRRSDILQVIFYNLQDILLFFTCISYSEFSSFLFYLFSTSFYLLFLVFC